MGEREEGRREGAGGERQGWGGGTRVTWPLGEGQVPLFLKEKLYPESEARVLNVFFQLT